MGRGWQIEKSNCPPWDSILTLSFLKCGQFSFLWRRALILHLNLPVFNQWLVPWFHTIYSSQLTYNDIELTLLFEIIILLLSNLPYFQFYTPWEWIVGKHVSYLSRISKLIYKNMICSFHLDETSNTTLSLIRAPYRLVKSKSTTNDKNLHNSINNWLSIRNLRTFNIPLSPLSFSERLRPF